MTFKCHQKRLERASASRSVKVSERCAREGERVRWKGDNEKPVPLSLPLLGHFFFPTLASPATSTLLVFALASFSTPIARKVRSTCLDGINSFNKARYRTAAATTSRRAHSRHISTSRRSQAHNVAVQPARAPRRATHSQPVAGVQMTEFLLHSIHRLSFFAVHTHETNFGSFS